MHVLVTNYKHWTRGSPGGFRSIQQTFICSVSHKKFEKKVFSFSFSSVSLLKNIFVDS